MFDNTGSYTLKATAAESSPDDYPDNMQTTGVVSIGGQVSGEIELPNDKDWFKVTLQAGTTYVFDLLGSAGNGGTLGLESNGAYLKLYNRSGYYVDGTANNGVGGDPRLSYTPTTSGNYYLSVSDLFDKTGSYVLKASLAPSVYPSNSRDIIVGSTGNDLIKGLGGSDKLSGGSGNDTLIGGIGNDTLLGGAGRDIIIGGAGRDSLVGGAGNDVFDFNALIDLGKNQKSRDVISDFSIGKDKIDLSSIGLDLKLPEKQSFVFVENFNAAGQVKFSNGVVYLNVDGDLAAEYQIRVLGASTLSASDFIL